MSCPCLGGVEEENRADQYAVPNGVVPGQASMHADAQAASGAFDEFKLSEAAGSVL